jgi:hypothetical protein
VPLTATLPVDAVLTTLVTALPVTVSLLGFALALKRLPDTVAFVALEMLRAVASEAKQSRNSLLVLDCFVAAASQ